MSSKYRVTATEDYNEPTTSNILKNSFGSYHLGSFHSNNVSSRINLLTLNNACIFGQNVSHRNYSSSTVPEVKESFQDSAVDLSHQTPSLTSPSIVNNNDSAVPNVDSLAQTVPEVTASQNVSFSSLSPEGLEYIPVPPTPFADGIDPATLNALGEVSLKSLGLAGWSPIGLIQSLLEFVHVSTGLEWWGAIALTTVMLRVLLFPVVVVMQRSSAKLANYSPQMQQQQALINEAKEAGDQLRVSQLMFEMTDNMKKKGVSPFKAAMMPMIQLPVFVSMFIGLRRMANLPVMSLTAGGAYWFMDLTIPDPLYILPIITSSTMLLTIIVSSAQNKNNMTSPIQVLLLKGMRFIPIVMFPFIINFPGAVLVYWTTTNFVTLLQASLLKQPAVRAYLDIPMMIQHPQAAAAQKVGIVKAAKSALKTFKTTQAVQDRRRYDEIQFSKAGYGPVLKTFKYDPTKKSSPPSRKQSPISVSATVKKD